VQLHVVGGGEAAMPGTVGPPGLRTMIRLAAFAAGLVAGLSVPDRALHDLVEAASQIRKLQFATLENFAHSFLEKYC
jgi:hypothetical protein